MALMPPPPPPPTSHHPIGLSPPADDSDHDSDSGPESDTDTATPSALSPSTPRRLPLNSDDETSDLFLKQLKSAVESYPSLSSYCCGGSIPVSTTSRLSPSVQDSSKAAVTSPPITLRFDAPSGVILKLSLPASPQEETTPTKRKVEVEELLAACTPDIVTDDKVGRGQRVRSRKSSARLDKDSFSVDVHPADLGILDTIKQVLLPDVRLQSGDDDGKGKGRSLWDGVGTESWRDREEHWGVRAELCELRVYFSSSSNTQKALESVPRRGTHFGTLVICLPSAHQGGGQNIHHPATQFNPSLSPPQTRQPTTFLPTASLNPTISWSAFPRTTTHSILPITCGHLITLTYNLYTTEAIGGILQRYPIADPRLYPMFKIVRGLLGQEGFLTEGGTLGYYCLHPYHHTRRQTQHHMPYALQGTDAILFSVFRSLGLKAMVGPVLGDETWDEYSQIKEERLYRKMYDEGEAKETRSRIEESDEEMGDGGTEDDSDEEEDEDEEDGETARVGKGWWKLKMVASDAGRDKGRGDPTGGVFRVGGGPSSFTNTHYPLHSLPDVTWLNESSDKGWEIALVNLKSTSQATPKPTPTKKGNGKQPAQTAEEREDKFELMWQYSHAAIFVEIPAWGTGIRGSPRQ